MQVKVRKFGGLIPKFVEATAVMFDIFKVFDRVWDAGLLHKHSLMKFLVRHLALVCLFSVIDCFEWFWMASVFLLYINDLLDEVICNIAIYLMILLSTLSVIKYLICGSI